MWRLEKKKKNSYLERIKTISSNTHYATIQLTRFKNPWRLHLPMKENKKKRSKGGKEEASLLVIESHWRCCRIEVAVFRWCRELGLYTRTSICVYTRANRTHTGLCTQARGGELHQLLGCTLPAYLPSSPKSRDQLECIFVFNGEGLRREKKRGGGGGESVALAMKELQSP